MNDALIYLSLFFFFLLSLWTHLNHPLTVFKLKVDAHNAILLSTVIIFYLGCNNANSRNRFFARILNCKWTKSQKQFARVFTIAGERDGSLMTIEKSNSQTVSTTYIIIQRTSFEQYILLHSKLNEKLWYSSGYAAFIDAPCLYELRGRWQW